MPGKWKQSYLELEAIFSPLIEDRKRKAWTKHEVTILKHCIVNTSSIIEATYLAFNLLIAENLYRGLNATMLKLIKVRKEINESDFITIGGNYE